MTSRRGVALLVALWLVVAIATVTLALSLEAHEGRELAMRATERTSARAAATGALAIARAGLEQALRQLSAAGTSTAARLRASDPWIDADSLLADTIHLGTAAVHIQAEDLGAKLNINTITESDLAAFLDVILKNFADADALTQAITDWRDPDTLAHTRGGERAQYLAKKRLVLPTNRQFRSIDELRDVEGMTPERFELIRPYLTVQGAQRVNINSAPEAVLRSVPGLTHPADVVPILALRSQGQRIISLNQLPNVALFGGGNRVTLETAELELTFTVSGLFPTGATRLSAIITRDGNNSQVSWHSW